MSEWQVLSGVDRSGVSQLLRKLSEMGTDRASLMLHWIIGVDLFWDKGRYNCLDWLVGAFQVMCLV